MYKKEMLRPGNGVTLQFQKNTKAIFHFRSYTPKFEGKTLLKPEPKDIIDDSRTMGNGPFELLIGREFKLSAWDDMVQTMQEDEVARFVCPYTKVFDYATLSKTLREMALKKAGKEVPHTHRHCSFSLMKEGTGHPELDKLLQSRQDICFELELLRVEQPGNYRQDHWAMTDNEKYAAAASLKEEGNCLFRAIKTKQAAEKYFEALSFLEELIIKEKPQSKPWLAIAKQKAPLLLNYAQCNLLLEDFPEAIRNATAALEIDPINVKGLYRRAKAYAAVWDVEEAKKDFRAAASLEPSLAKAAEKEMKSLDERVKEKEAGERQKFKGMFDK